MTFLETRGQLAKLLATENLIVTHTHQANTASFNVETRELKLPVLNTNSEHVYNLFIAHECSHALHTPTDFHETIPEDVPQDYVNVVEDVRIERMIQQQFPGLRVDFARGYDELNQKDFFGIADRDLTTFSLIDRINLHFKLGARALMPFTDEEMTYVRAVDEADTWDKVCEVASMIAQYVKAKATKQTEMPNEMPGNNTSNNTSEGEQQQAPQPSNSSDSSQESDSDDSGDDTSSIGGQKSAGDKSETQQNFDSKLQSITDTFGRDFNYVKTPTEGLDFIISANELRDSFGPGMPSSSIEGEEAFHDFLDSVKRDVNFMVQQFEMRKSADAYARTTVHKTGELNMNMLHEYKLTEDLFLRQNVTPDGKNHGMIMYLDWSGSMCDVCHNTIKQILVLVQFCRKVQIPFEVYAFTTSDNIDDARNTYKPEYKGRVILNGIVKLVQVLTSTAKKVDLEQDMLNLWYTSYNSYYYPHSPIMGMGGTPLDNALFALPAIVAEFRANTKAQKVSFVCITDGQSSPVQHWIERKLYRDEAATPCPAHTWGERVMIRDGAKVIPIDDGYMATGQIARYVADIIGECTITTMFIGKPGACERYAEHLGQTVNAGQLKRENATVVQTENSWPVVCLLLPKAFGDAQEEIDVEAGESKAKIKNALKKYLQSKQSSKYMLSTLAHQFS